MTLNKTSDIFSEDYNDNYSISVFKITALWAFSESSLGGILHALTIPLRGIFINAAAVLFISLIALFSKSSKEILKSTLIVILIKALVSPHSPLTAYFAVSLQGFVGYLLFLNKNFFRISALLLGIITLTFSGIQKIIVLTILFGNTLWKSINVFINQLSNKFLTVDLDPGINYGYLLASVYVSIHIISGIFIGMYAGLLPIKIKLYARQLPANLFDDSENNFPAKDKSLKKKSWLTRPTGIIIIVISLIVLILSYFSPTSIGINYLDIIFMLTRSIVITLLWYVLVAPFVQKLFNKYLSSKRFYYRIEVDEIINLFPNFKKVVSYCWKNSAAKKGLKRIHYFLSNSFYYLLLSK